MKIHGPGCIQTVLILVLFTATLFKCSLCVPTEPACIIQWHQQCCSSTWWRVSACYFSDSLVHQSSLSQTQVISLQDETTFFLSLAMIFKSLNWAIPRGTSFFTWYLHCLPEPGDKVHDWLAISNLFIKARSTIVLERWQTHKHTIFSTTPSHPPLLDIASICSILTVPWLEI